MKTPRWQEQIPRWQDQFWVPDPRKAPYLHYTYVHSGFFDRRKDLFTMPYGLGVRSKRCVVWAPEGWAMKVNPSTDYKIFTLFRKTL